MNGVDKQECVLHGAEEVNQMDGAIRWLFEWRHGLALVAGLTALIVAYWGGLADLLWRWSNEPEYSHGYMLPLVTLYFLWEKRDTLERIPTQSTWMAPLLVLLALVVAVVGEISALYILVHLSFLVVLFGFSLALLGWRGASEVFAPLAFLAFAIPLPYFLQASLTAELQLISSSLGVSFIRFCDIPVFRAGNVIDLGTYKLQVAEACSGLTYLYPLLGCGFMLAYIYRAVWWKRLVIVISAIPITVLLNSFRIGVIGILVNNWGLTMAEGFLHDFEGWFVFMVAVAILLLEMWLLTFLGPDKAPFGSVFGFQQSQPHPPNLEVMIKTRPLPSQFLAVCLLAGLAIPVIYVVDNRSEVKLTRQSFVSFPMSFAGWQGIPSALERPIIEKLKLTDYILADFKGPAQAAVNFYVAFYDSQRKGVSPHSPRVCLPGGGWEISHLSRRDVTFDDTSLPRLPVNRVIIRKGDAVQLVYYWFQQRGHRIANEYSMKWYLFKDALWKNRTDGGMIRLTTFMIPGEPEGAADERLSRFAGDVSGLLSGYVPE